MPRASRPSVTQPAYVLHSYAWSETSLIVDLFTRERGRVAVAAKGAKRPYSQLRSVLLPFQRLTVGLGKLADNDEVGEVQTLRSAEWAGGPPMLSGAALFSGFYLNELLMKLLARHEPLPAVFDAYAQTLPAVGLGGDAEQAALRAFELWLLRQLGVLPDLSVVTLTTEPVRAERSYALRAEAGVVLLAQGEEGGCGGGVMAGLQAALGAGRLFDVQLACAQAGTALRTQLRHLLHYHLGSPQLRTRQVMLDVQRLLD